MEKQGELHIDWGGDRSEPGDSTIVAIWQPLPLEIAAQAQQRGPQQRSILAISIEPLN